MKKTFLVFALVLQTFVAGLTQLWAQQPGAQQKPNPADQASQKPAQTSDDDVVSYEELSRIASLAESNGSG